MFARVKRWGNSFAIRLSKRELERLGVKEGDPVKVEVTPLPREGKVDLSGLPGFEDPDPQASVNHDKLLYGS